MAESVPHAPGAQLESDQDTPPFFESLETVGVKVCVWLNWMVEAGAPNALLRRGFNKQSLLAGTVITVEGYQAKDGAMRANGRDITYQDGRKLFVGSSGTGAPDERPEK